MIRHPSTFIQRTLAMFISLGHYEAQLRRLGQSPKDRHAELTRAMKQYLPECRITPVRGGGSCWVQSFPPRSWRARQPTTGFSSSQAMVLHGHPQHRQFHSPGLPVHSSQIRQGIKALAEALHSL